MITVGFIGKRLMKHQSEELSVSERLIGVFSYNWRVKAVSLIIAVIIVYLKTIGIIGNG